MQSLADYDKAEKIPSEKKLLIELHCFREKIMCISKCSRKY